MNAVQIALSMAGVGLLATVGLAAHSLGRNKFETGAYAIGTGMLTVVFVAIAGGLKVAA